MTISWRSRSLRISSTTTSVTSYPPGMVVSASGRSTEHAENTLSMACHPLDCRSTFFAWATVRGLYHSCVPLTKAPSSHGESDALPPGSYVCYICHTPLRGQASTNARTAQDWRAV